jgi:hypothetical protein
VVSVAVVVSGVLPCGESTPLGVGELQALLPDALAEDAILFPEVLNDGLLLPAKPP